MRLILGLLRQFGFDPLRTVRSIQVINRYLIDSFKFLKKRGFSRITFSPILTDFHDEAGLATGHYFWQDLICAKWIYEANPKTHFDVGSRIDGFIAHLLSFREVMLVDIRNLDQDIPNLITINGDAQIGFGKIQEKFDSVSSLHSIEHFGLGRYGDTIDPDGHIKGLVNISSMVESGGYLYLSFPIGVSKIEFNAQRIVSPEFPFKYLPDFILVDFVLIPWKGAPIYNLDPHKLGELGWGNAGLYRLKRI